MKKLLSIGAGVAAAMAVASPAQAATVLLGVFSGNDCQGGFSSCFATQAGVNVEGGALPSPVVVKFNGNETDQEAELDPFEVDEVSTFYGTVDGSEFEIDFLEGNIVSFSYDPEAGDPELHYFVIKQGREYALYYDASPILGGSVDLDSVGFDAGADSFSHITFFNTGVPEPSTWAMLILGFGVIGGALRAARRKAVGLRYV